MVNKKRQSSAKRKEAKVFFNQILEQEKLRQNIDKMNKEYLEDKNKELEERELYETIGKFTTEFQREKPNREGEDFILFCWGLISGLIIAVIIFSLNLG